MTDQIAIPSVPVDLHDQMWGMVTSYWVSQIVRAVVDLSLADHLAAQSLTAVELAEREGSAPDTTFRLMRAPGWECLKIFMGLNRLKRWLGICARRRSGTTA